MRGDMKPCPFCGGTNISVGEVLGKYKAHHYTQTECLSCGAEGPKFAYNPRDTSPLTADERSGELWNGRASDSGPRPAVIR